MNIILDNTLYDITAFVDEHPGGSNVFKTDTDLTKKFNDAGHSSYAVSLLSNYKVKEIPPTDPRYVPSNKIEYNQTKISKLFTHEDRFNIHKIMGLVSLMNYLYLFVDFAYTGFNEHISLRTVGLMFIALTWCHLILSLSSLQFLIPRVRTGILPMIWQEARLHSIVFASRSFIIVNIIYFMGTNSFTNFLRFLIILITMKLADISTNHYSFNNERTTATLPYWTSCTPELQSRIKYFYTHAQVMATGTCLFDKIPFILYLAFPIQFAMFLMTLVRKNIISSFQYHLLYGLSLLSGYITYCMSYKVYLAILLGFVFTYLRITRSFGKYYIWTITYLANKDNVFERIIEGREFSVDEILNNFKLIMWVSIIFYFSNTMFDKRVLSETNTRVISNKKISENIHIISIKFVNRLDFKPGQYINLFVDNDKRPYTPIHYDNNIAKFCIKSYQSGTFSNRMTELYTENKVIYYKGSFGTKYYIPESDTLICNNQPVVLKNVIMFSCGTGITPFYSILTNVQPNTKYNFKLFASFRHREEAVLVNDFEKHTKLYISSEGNRMTAAECSDIVSNYGSSTIVLVCGTREYNGMIINECACKNVLSYVF